MLRRWHVTVNGQLKAAVYASHRTAEDIDGEKEKKR